MNYPSEFQKQSPYSVMACFEKFMRPRCTLMNPTEVWPKRYRDPSFVPKV